MKYPMHPRRTNVVSYEIGKSEFDKDFFLLNQFVGPEFILDDF